MRKLVLIVLTWSLILGVVFVGWAAELASTERKNPTATEIPWTPEIAKQLVSLGWENPAAPLEEPVVVYSLSFVELNARFESVFEASFHVSDERGEKSNLELIVDEEAIELVTDYPKSLVADFEAWQAKQSAGTGGDVWLVTIGRRPVSLLMQEEDIKEDEEDRRLLSKFEIAFEPQEIDLAGQRVLTGVSLGYLGLRGELASSKATLWVTRTPERPLAIVSQKLTGSKDSARKYFAMYAAVTVLSPDQLPKDAAFVRVCDVGKLRRILAPEKPMRQHLSELGLLVGTSDSKFAMEAFVAQYLTKNHLAGASVSSHGDECGYELFLEWNMLDELRLVTRLTDDPLRGIDPVLRLGLSDETRIGKRLYLRFSYLPVHLLLPDGDYSWETYGEFIFRLAGDRVELWYKGELIDDELLSQVGLEMMMTPAFGLRTVWDEIQDQSDRVLLGIVYKH